MTTIFQFQSGAGNPACGPAFQPVHRAKLDSFLSRDRKGAVTSGGGGYHRRRCERPNVGQDGILRAIGNRAGLQQTNLHRASVATSFLGRDRKGAVTK